jgi:hypothetical protein
MDRADRQREHEIRSALNAVVFNRARLPESEWNALALPASVEAKARPMVEPIYARAKAGHAGEARRLAGLAAETIAAEERKLDPPEEDVPDVDEIATRVYDRAHGGDAGRFVGEDKPAGGRYDPRPSRLG